MVSGTDETTRHATDIVLRALEMIQGGSHTDTNKDDE